MAEDRDDAALMRDYAAGDAAAFEQLYARHRGPLYRYLTRQCRDRELANDLFQEVWSKIVSSRDSYQPRAKFQTYLFTIAYNTFIDHCRRTAVRPRVAEQADADLSVPAPEQDAPLAGAEQAELAQQLRAALASLPMEQRDVFLLYEESGLSLEQIADVTGVGMETAKSRLRYAVAKLRRSLASVERSP